MQKENQKQYAKNGQILGEETLTVSGRATKWYRVKAKNGKTYLTTFFIIGDRIYDLTILDDGDVSSSDPLAKKFIDSFKSTRNNINSASTKGRGEGK